ncbi:helix-turn-helix transcriptional regulator [Streptacidiphilus sp. P02-A3a]|uniref:helix-turn-helix domain-containing protein n=1 Tax=Streptacidiphilus sp. P02-A3a TaxID=2704468 RepID=UPI0015FB8741|nr:helix-turn-helix transcriptional regulator [Streptacidiphilus sp. P02-A3a]QMU71865.1 helix-turn-helix domain-containing protein [Streptacidiphilus sp. P02-A3a]
MAAPVPTVRRRQLGAELRKLRESKKLLLEDVEQGTGIDAAKLSRLETAKNAAKLPDVERLLDFYGFEGDGRELLLALVKEGGQRGWWLAYRDRLSQFNWDLVTLEDGASRILAYQQGLLHGLLQTSAYARAAIGATRLEDRGTPVDSQIEIRMARQSVLTKPNPPKFWSVIHESALSVSLAEPSVMRDQLDRLRNLSQLPNVEIQIMPASAAPHPGLAGSFTVLGFSERHDLDVVHTGGLLNASYIEDRDEVELYASAFQKVTAEAMPLEASLRFITEQRDKISE